MTALGTGLRRAVLDHVRRHAGVYVFLTILFGMGVAFGALAVGALDATQRLELSQYLDFFLQTLDDPGSATPAGAVFRQALSSNWRTAGFIVLLGLTVVGVPLVPAIVFLRGFIVGFSVGFLLASRGWQGMAISLLAVVPQNLLIVPAVVGLSAAALVFAGGFLRRGSQRGPALVVRVAQYLTAAAVAFATLAAASLIEGYVAPLFLRLVAGMPTLA